MPTTSEHTRPDDTTDLLRQVVQMTSKQESRITRLEADFEAMGRTLTGIADDVKSIKASRDTNWQLLISTIAVFMALTGALWGLAIRPISVEIEYLKARTDVANEATSARIDTMTSSLSSKLTLIDSRVNESTANQRTTSSKLEEVETQFMWLADVMNLITQHEETVMAVLWREVYGQDMPRRDYWPLHMGGRRGER